MRLKIENKRFLQEFITRRKDEQEAEALLSDNEESGCAMVVKTNSSATMELIDSIHEVGLMPEETETILKEMESCESTDSNLEFAFVHQKIAIQMLQVPLASFEHSLSFCSKSLDVFEKLPSAIARSNRFQSQSGPANVTGIHDAYQVQFRNFNCY